MQAMILAAGFGTRLLPHTNYKPKPLFPILNEPLLLLTIRRLQRFGFTDIIVNCHHLKEQIVDALKGMTGVLLQEEELILGTGGGLRQALPKLRKEPLLITNGDIYHTIDYKKLYEYHLRQGYSATLAMHDYPRFNSVTVDYDYVRSFSKDGEGTKLAFTGLHVLDPSVLEEIEAGSCSCIIDRYRRLLEENRVIGVYRTDDSFWTDMGTLQDYLELHAGLLLGQIPRWQEFDKSSTTQLIEKDAKIDKSAQINGWASIGKAEIGADVVLNNCVVWDGCTVKQGEKITDTLVSLPLKRQVALRNYPFQIE